MKLCLILILIFAPMLLTIVFADSHNIITISLADDKDMYYLQYYTNIEIYIQDYDPSSKGEIYYTIIAPDGNTVYTETLIPESDGSFVRVFGFDGSILKLTGDYIFEVQYEGNSDSIVVPYTNSEETNYESMVTSLYIDKQQYSMGETVYVNGDVLVVTNEHDLLIYNSYHVNIPQPEIILFNGDTIEFSYEFELDDISYTPNTTYTVIADYQYGSMEVTFDVLSPIQFQTDKSVYYTGEEITVNGTMVDVIWLDDKDIYYDIYEDENIIDSGSGGVIDSADGTFNFEIPPLNMDYSGTFNIVVTIQGVSSDNYSITYSHTENMENETLYDYIIENKNMLNNHDSTLIQHESEMNTSTTMLNMHDGILSLYQEVIDGFNERLVNIEEDRVSINNYLGDDRYPDDLSPVAIDNTLNEMAMVSSGIVKANTQIDSIMAQLEQAEIDENDELITQLEKSIGSLILKREMSQSKLDVYEAYFEKYPQLNMPPLPSIKA